MNTGEHQLEQEKWHDKATAAQNDLRDYLKHIQCDVGVLGHDPESENSQLFLLEFCRTLSEILLQDDSGDIQQWLSEELTQVKPETILALQLSGFSPALHADQVNGSGDINNIAGRAGDIEGFLGLKAVQEWPVYESFSRASKTVLGTLQSVVADVGRELWNLSTEVLAPAISRVASASEARALYYMASMAGALPIPATIELTHDYEGKLKRWNRDHSSLLKKNPLKKGVFRAIHQNQLQNEWQHYHQQITRPESQRPRRYTVKHIHFDDVARSQLAYLSAAMKVRSQQVEPYLKALTEKIGQGGGLLALIVVGMNIINTYHTRNDDIEKGGLTAHEERALASNLAYTANAVAAMWQSVALQRLQNSGQESLVMGQTAKYLVKEGHANVAKNLRSFGLRSAVMGGLGILAIGLEGAQALKTFGETTNSTERW